ncbi:unnamed protein product [Rotaria sp. Silwood1]|nr:unnamed protein product [Rotaria sp. Silwood1]
MGFFIRDLHNQIAKLHTEQFDGHSTSNTFTVYHGQGLSKSDFNRLMKTKGGLLSFNNFLSTSIRREVSFTFARQTMESSDLIGIVFIIKIDPSIASTPFADIRNVSYIKGEKGILISIHSIFRIGSIKRINGNRHLWQVDLTLTSDNDPQLHALTELIRQKTYPKVVGWYRLGIILNKLRQSDKAQEVYDILLNQATTDRDKAYHYHMLGMALSSYQKALKIRQKNFPSTHPDLAVSYNNIGSVYDHMGDYSKALSSHKKALEIRQKNLPSNHPDLAQSYNNIGLVYDNMRDYSNALSSLQKALEIQQQTLPPNHLDLATSYNNIGSVYDNLGDYSSALSFHQKALEIREKTSPSHPADLATSYNNIESIRNPRKHSSFKSIHFGYFLQQYWFSA